MLEKTYSEKYLSSKVAIFMTENPFPLELDKSVLDSLLKQFLDHNAFVSSELQSNRKKSYRCVPFFLPVPENIEIEKISREILKTTLATTLRGFTNNYVYLPGTLNTDVQVDSKFEINRKNGKNIQTPALHDIDRTCVNLHFLLSNNGYFPSLQIKDFGGSKKFGVIATSPIRKNTFLGRYSGSIHSLREGGLFSEGNDNFDLTHKHKSENCAVVRARYVANIARFINGVDELESKGPNVRVFRSSNIDPENNENMSILLVSINAISEGEELIYNYNSLLVCKGHVYKIYYALIFCQLIQFKYSNQIIVSVCAVVHVLYSK